MANEFIVKNGLISKGNTQSNGGLSLPSTNVRGSGTTTIDLTIDDFFVRAKPNGGELVTYRLPTNPSGSNQSRNGQVLIICVGDSPGDVTITDSLGSILEPTSSLARNAINIRGYNGNVTLYYDGDESKWVVTSTTGTINYSP